MNEKKVQFELSSERLRELDALKDACRLETRKDLFNNALTLLEWVVSEYIKGRSIASVDENEKSYRELQMPIFSQLNRLRPAEKQDLIKLMT
ncbi:MAG: hypothetical protein MN733_06575 [Nitrososphaera sp.]|nr:hypothetical protein [Nitrososphaera sp.]